ncbi:protein ELYS homolog [Drosophila novamexicana]|uniref:protein ELYS homolog n=1 Tax=Drosophila novamexicana TaxID=47314 RepID=UPI0011E5F727|nr:protein ELYS homolog [Drosophila novamexicana]
MEWHEIGLIDNRASKFPERSIPGYEEVFGKQIDERSIAADYIGGIINDGSWGWLTRQHADAATILICQLSNGYRVASYTFLRENERKIRQRSSIRCVQELFPTGIGRRILLAVCIELVPGRTQLAIYTPTNSQVLRYIDLNAAGISTRSMTFLNERLCASTILRQFDGCLALGTDAGTVLLLDVNASQAIANRSTNVVLPDSEVQRSDLMCVSVRDAAALERLDGKLRRCRQQDVHVALEFDMPVPARNAITSLIPLPLISGFAAGLHDGRICAYDLRRLQLVAQLRMPADQQPAPVVGLCCIEPPDDPQPCFYICSVYNSGDHLMASLHSLNYRRSALSVENCDFDMRDFQSATTRIRLALDNGSCSLMSCGTASTFALSGDYGTILTAISWHSHTDNRNKLILFDINQWYKDEMPSSPRPDEKLDYLCGFVFSGQYAALSMQLDSRSIIPFISMQRHDDYYYPKALSFDCFLMTITGCCHFEYMGVQRRFLNSLYYNKGNVFLNPKYYLEEIIELRLLPQFHEYDPNVSLSRREMYELLLSMGLEQDRLWLLNSCARNCMDGSYLCNMMSPTKLTLSILTNWIVKRAGQIKTRCSELCQGIFDYGGYALDERERKEYQELNGQLYKLQNLQAFLVRLGKARLGHELVEDLSATERALTVLYEYQRILYWLIDRAILPESSEQQQQPLQLIRREYADRRARQRQNQHIRLYIDEQLQHSGFKAGLQRQSEQDGLYPPRTLQSLMRLMLLPDAKLDHKHELMLYVLHDVDQLLVPKRKRPLYQDFAMAFGIAEPLLKCARSFWFLDNGDYEQTIDVLYRGRLGHSSYTEWQTKHLIETLLAHRANQEAMQVVHMPPGFISSELKLQVLLANNNIPEAFHHARIYMDDDGRPLLERFFRHCILNGKFTVLATLCLREHEEQLVYRQLRQCKTRATDCVQLILLLKRCKYIEAVSFMDEVAAEREQGPNDETSGILSAYRTTMAPVTQSIAGTYFRIRDKLNGDQLRNPSPEPFSCQLAKQNANGQLGNIFQSSALSAHWATRYANGKQAQTLNSRNMPFLRNAAQSVKDVPQLRRHVRPTQFQYVEKRMLNPNLANCSRDVVQQPSKRPRLEFGNALETFVQRSLELAEQELAPEQEQQPPMLHDERELAALLEPPAYLMPKSVQQEPAAVTNQEQLRPTILKRRRSRCQSAQPLVAERQSFSFMPPIPLDDFARAASDQDVEMMVIEEPEEVEEEEEEGTDEIFVEIEQQPASPSPSSEVEQEQQPQQQPHDSGSNSDTDSEYLSPLASANVSFVDSSQEQRAAMAPPTGPQPRGSLLLARSSQQESSGFGSFATVHMGSTTGSLQLNEFVPPVCSSKMCEVASTSSTVKISERTTICGDMDEPSVGTSPQAWSMPSSLLQPPTQPQMLRMLDTTLGMSSYDMTLALEQAAEQEPQPAEQAKTTATTAYIDLDEDEVEEEQQQQQEEEEEEEQQQQQQVQEEQPVQQQQQPEQEEEVEEDEEDEEEEEQSSHSSNEEPATLNYNRDSPSYSVSSELSDMSSSGVVGTRQARQDAPVYSIVVESTNSISNSRSPTSHTPTSFLPSDTNVSQTSSPPRAAHGGAAAGGSNRSLYRANSLETVDDLDTTKGSLEEDDDLDEEDECVIALDGTEVRGYVARPEPLTACSSAELFAFKQQDESVPPATQVPCPSLGATANSDSYTINLDSLDSAELQQSIAPSRPAATAAPAAIVLVTPSDAGSSNQSVATVAFSEHKDQLDMEREMTVPAAKATDYDAELVMDVDMTEAAPRTLEQPISLDSDVEFDPCLTLSDTEQAPEGEEQVDEVEEPVRVSVATTLPTIEEAARQPLVRIKRTRQSLTGTPPVPERSIRLRSDDQRRSESSNRSTPSPVTGRQLRSLRRRSSSALSEEQLTPDASTAASATPPVAQPAQRQRRLRSDDSVASMRRVLRGSSLPPISTVPVSTPKRRRKLLARPLEAIEEAGESPALPRTRSRTHLSQLASSPAVGSWGSIAAVAGQESDSGTPTRKPRSCSEPPALLPARSRRARKPSGSEEQKQEAPPVEPRNLRSRRSTLEVPPAEQPPAPAADVPDVSEASVPPKKRGRSKK